MIRSRVRRRTRTNIGLLRCLRNGLLLIAFGADSNHEDPLVGITSVRQNRLISILIRSAMIRNLTVRAHTVANKARNDNQRLISPLLLHYHKLDVILTRRMLSRTVMKSGRIKLLRSNNLRLSALKATMRSLLGGTLLGLLREDLRDMLMTN